LSKGEIKDIGTPYDLLNDKNSILYDLVYSLDENEAKELFQMASKK
jgi:hypothetical protein